MRILDREAARLAERRNRLARHEITFDPQAVNDHVHEHSCCNSHVGGGAGNDGGPRGDSAAGGGGAETGWLAALLPDAVAAGAISATEHRVVAERLAQSGESWSAVAARLGMTATACAVAHSRAVPKLRVFLFTERSALAGGERVIAEAFGRLGRRRSWTGTGRSRPIFSTGSRSEAVREAGQWAQAILLGQFWTR